MTSDRGRVWANLGLALLTLLVCLLTLEVAARLLRLGRDAENTHVLRNVAPGKLSYAPDSEQRYQTSEIDFTMKANRYGRRDDEWTQEMLDDPSNVVFIGDSFVLGYGVADSSTQPSLLERSSARAGRPVQVFNFGFTGGPPEYVRLLEDALDLGVAARLVVVGLFTGNDFAIGPILSPAQKRAADGRRLRLPKSVLARYLKQRIVSSPRAVGLMLKLGDVLGVPLYSSPQSFVFLRSPSKAQIDHVEAVLAHLATMRALCEGANKKLVVVIFPNKVQVENPGELTSSIYDADRPNMLIREFCEREGLDCLDLTPVLRGEFARTRRPLYFSVDRHLTERGNEVAAAAVFGFLEYRRPAGLSEPLPVEVERARNIEQP